MAIAKKPGNRSALDVGDAAAERFIAAAAPQPAVQPSDRQEPIAAVSKLRRKPAMVRFDAKLLARVDAAAERRGISRSAWIQYTLSRALDDEEAGR
jgi:hypothetical protein